MKSCATPLRPTTFVLTALMASALLLCACEGQKEQAAPPPPEVTVMEVIEQEMVLSTELPGRTSAFLVAEVRPQVSGIIQKRLFKEGSVVKAGQILYQIDPAPFQAAYESARASLARAEANLQAISSRAKRYEGLLAEGAVSQQDFDDVTSAFKQAQAEVAYWKAAAESARINLGYTRVNAPISGRIGRSNMTEGALVTANQPAPLATIQQFDPIYVDVPQSTADLLKLKRRIESGSLHTNQTGRKQIRLILEDGSEYPLTGTMEFRDVSVDPTTGTVTLRAVFPNPEELLLPGMFVRAVVQEGVNRHAILIPQQAVSRDPKGNPLALSVDADSAVQQQFLTIDRAVGNQWLIASGLTPGDRIIIEGVQKVRPGVKVHVSTSETKPQNPDTTDSPGQAAGSRE